jgi:hypothetical protein
MVELVILAGSGSSTVTYMHAWEVETRQCFASQQSDEVTLSVFFERFFAQKR